MCVTGWATEKQESLEKHIGKLYWNCERLGAYGKQKWKNILFYFVIYTPPFPSWLSLWTSLFPLSMSKQRSRLVRNQLAGVLTPKLSWKFPSASSAMFAASPTADAPSSFSHCYVHLQNETFPLPAHVRRINRSVWCRREHLKNPNPFLPFLCHPCHQQKHADARSFISDVLINGTSGISDKFYLKENSPELKYLNVCILLLKLYLIRTEVLVHV